MPAEFLLAIAAAALIAGLIAFFLIRWTRWGGWIFWALLLGVGAVVYWLGTQEVGHMAGLGHAVFLFVIWAPAVLGALIGSWLGWRRGMNWLRGKD